MSQAPRPKVRPGTQAVFYSLTHREQYSAVKPFSEKNAERFETATCLVLLSSLNMNKKGYLFALAGAYLQAVVKK